MPSSEAIRCALCILEAGEELLATQEAVFGPEHYDVALTLQVSLTLA